MIAPCKTNTRIVPLETLMDRLVVVSLLWLRSDKNKCTDSNYLDLL
jgi:hypothetical protein